MRRLGIFIVLLACGSPAQPPKPAVVTTPTAPPVVQQDDESRARAFVAKLVASDWDGAVSVFDDKMRSALPKDKLSATWEAIGKGAGAFKSIDGVDIKPDGAFHIAVVKATFEKAPLLLRVVLDGEGRVTGFFVAPGDTAADWKPPSYANADSFEEKRVSITWPGAVAPLPGTWTTPKSGKPFGAVVLVHGSGPNGEDETIGALKVFKDLAWGLASRGLAVLRYDKRTRVTPVVVPTQKEEVEDAAHAAVAFVAAQPDVDPKRIVVVGHSQGGYLAPRIAKSDPAIKGLVMLAGSTRSLQDSLVAQLRYMATLQPTEPKLKEAVVQAERFKVDVESPTLKPDDVLHLPLLTTAGIPGTYFLDVRAYHPEKVAADLKIPMLVLQGERDYQVTVAEDFAGWKTALGKKKDVTLKTYAGLNHAFTVGEGPPSPADYTKPGHVDEKVVVDIAEFVQHLR
jgi:dienelactone hydrolase